MRLLLCCLITLAACDRGAATCAPGSNAEGSNASVCPCTPSRDACDAPADVICRYLDSPSTYSCVGEKWTPSGDVDAGVPCSPAQGGRCDLGEVD